jgi:Histidine kinase
MGVGLCGAGLDLLADGSGYVIGYMAVAGLALRTPPRVAVLAERSRLARDLHDVLAHSLSVLAVQLEAARLTAITAATPPRKRRPSGSCTPH